LSICLLHAVFGGSCLPTDFINVHPGSITSAQAEYNISELMGFKDVVDGALYEEASSLLVEQLQRYGVSYESCQPCFQQASSRESPDAAATEEVSYLQRSTISTKKAHHAASRHTSIQGAVNTMQLEVVAHTYISTDPKASAEFFVEYFKAHLMPAIACEPGSEVVAVQIPLEDSRVARYSFVRAAKLPSGNLQTDRLIAKSDAEVAAYFTARTGANGVFDNHDGLHPCCFKLEKALSDGVQLAAFDEVSVGIPYVVLRINIPHTQWTLEFPGPRGWMDDKLVEEYAPAPCRDPALSGDDYPFESPWPKSTFTAADPQLSADWVAKILGGEVVPSPYPTPQEEGCPTAAWTVFRAEKFMLHFVKSAELAINAYMESNVHAIGELRNLSAGQFDYFMLNSLVFEVESLDVFVRRLEGYSAPFLLTRLGMHDGYALFADIPGCGQVVQLRSKHVSVADPVPLSVDACLLQY